MVAVAIGATLGILLTILLKGYSIPYVIEHQKTFVLNYMAAFFNGVFVSLFWVLKYREARAAEALHKAEAERHLLSKHAVESELKLMQAQVEPHFLFNTLASVQFLTETDPPQASRMLGHLLAYLRAALPQLRRGSTTLGQEVELAEAYLNILRMRMGARLEFAIDVPEALRTHPFPPVLLISVVENAVTHGLEPQAAGGRVTIAARQEADRLVVTVTDTGTGSVRQLFAARTGRRTCQRARSAERAFRSAGALCARGGGASRREGDDRGSVRARDAARRKRARHRVADADRADRRRRADAAGAAQGAPRRGVAGARDRRRSGKRRRGACPRK